MGGGRGGEVRGGRGGGGGGAKEEATEEERRKKQKAKDRGVKTLLQTHSMRKTRTFCYRPVSTLAFRIAAAVGSFCETRVDREVVPDAVLPAGMAHIPGTLIFEIWVSVGCGRTVSSVQRKRSSSREWWTRQVETSQGGG